MLLGAAILVLFLGTVSARPGRAVRPVPSRHHSSPAVNPFIQARHPLTQGFLCDWCVVSVEDGQAALRENLDQIIGILDSVAELCAYCPVQDQCTEVFKTDIPAALNAALNESPNDVCTDAGLCDANATIQGMVMGSLRGDFARDRVIKRMLMRARVMQQKMIRIILGEDYMCTSCLDIVRLTREALLDNETQHEVVDFLAPLCAYLPDAYRTECNDFVQSLPELFEMAANDFLTDSVCTEAGFCSNQTESTPDVSATFPDFSGVVSRLGLPGVLPVMPGGQNPFQFPGSDRQNPFRFPGQGRGPYGYPSRPREHPSQSRPGNGRTPYQFPSRVSPITRPQQQPAPWASPVKWPGSTNPRPYKPQVPSIDDIKIPNINVDDYLSKIAGGIMDHLPARPDMPDIDIPRVEIPNLPRQGLNDQSRRHRGGKKGHQRRQRSLVDLAEIGPFLGVAKDDFDQIHHEYLPEPIPDDGITIVGNGGDENCELCKVAVSSARSWFEENAPKMKKILSRIVLPVCKVFPSPMKEDCTSDMKELIQTTMERIAAMLQPESVCTKFGICVAPEEFFPTTQIVDMATEVRPTTEKAGVDWPIPLLNRWKNFPFGTLKV